MSGQRVGCWLVWLSPPEWRARARIQVTTGRGGASPPWKPAMREWRDMARAGRAGGEYRLLTCRARHACYTHAYMPQSTAGGDGERRRKKQEPGKVRGVRSFRCVLSAHRQTTCNLELNKPSCTRADRHRSNIEVSQNPAARDQRRAGVGCERVQSSHGSPAPFCAQVPGRSDGCDAESADKGLLRYRSPAGKKRRNKKRRLASCLPTSLNKTESCREGTFAIRAFAIYLD